MRLRRVDLTSPALFGGVVDGKVAEVYAQASQFGSRGRGQLSKVCRVDLHVTVELPKGLIDRRRIQRHGQASGLALRARRQQFDELRLLRPPLALCQRFNGFCATQNR